MILALDKETGQKIWELNVNVEIGPVGASLSNRLLFEPTDKIQVQSKNMPRGGGSIVAFEIPQINDAPTRSKYTVFSLPWQGLEFPLR